MLFTFGLVNYWLKVGIPGLNHKGVFANAELG